MLHRQGGQHKDILAQRRYHDLKKESSKNEEVNVMQHGFLNKRLHTLCGLSSTSKYRVSVRFFCVYTILCVS